MDLNKLLKELNSIQSKAKEEQDAIVNKEFIGKAAGGVVTITLKGDYECLSIKIDKELLEEQDEELLEDSLMSAFNDATNQIQEAMDSVASTLSSGMNFPGM